MQYLISIVVKIKKKVWNHEKKKEKKKKKKKKNDRENFLVIFETDDWRLDWLSGDKVNSAWSGHRSHLG